VPDADIATVLGIDLATLRRHHHGELATGQIVANARVAESLFRKAIGDGPQSVAAAMFWLKARAGWRETAVSPGRGVDARSEAKIVAELEAAAEEVTRKIEAATREPDDER
jgi:hypothetical protein